MGKVKRKSIPSSLSRYLAVCFAVCAAGVLLICTVSGYLEAWSDARLSGLPVNSGPPAKAFPLTGYISLSGTENSC